MSSDRSAVFLSPVSLTAALPAMLWPAVLPVFMASQTLPTSNWLLETYGLPNDTLSAAREQGPDVLRSVGRLPQPSFSNRRSACHAMASSAASIRGISNIADFQLAARNL